MDFRVSGDSPANLGSDLVREESDLGDREEMTSDSSSHLEQRPTPVDDFPNAGEGGGGSLSSTGRGEVFHEEEQPNGVHDNSLARPSDAGDIGDVSSGLRKPKITRSESAPVENAGQCEKLPSNVLELAVRLSESLGIAVATVFHEVFERSREFRSSVSPVDELSDILGAALKESLFVVLGNERTIFVENFRISFRSTYQTIRSVSREYAKAGDRLTPSNQRYCISWGSSQEKPRRVSLSQPYRERTRKTKDVCLDTKDTVVRNRFPKTAAKSKHLNFSVESQPDEETTSFTPERYARRGQRLHSPCSSSKSCECAQSAFFTNTTIERDSDAAGSCNESCLNESLELSFYTSSSRDPGRQDGSRSRIMKLSNESSGSLQPVSAVDARDVHSERLDSDDSWDVGMFTASSGTDSDEYMIVDKGENGASVHGRNIRGLTITFDSRTPKKDSNNSRRVVEYKTIPPPPRSAEDSMQDGSPGVSFGSGGRSPTVDSTHCTKAVAGSDILGRSVVGDSPQQTKSAGTSNTLYNQHPTNPGASPRVLRDTSPRVPALSSLDRLGDRHTEAQSPQDNRSRASLEIGESWRGAGEPGTSSEQTSRAGAGLFGTPWAPDEANYENILANRSLGWRDDSQLAGPSLEGTVLPPFFNCGVRLNPRQTLLERYVEAQETQNHLRQLELAHNMKRLIVKQDHLELQSESNVLMRENVDLGRCKIELKEFELEDGKLTAAYRDLSRTCADELVAGLCVMLCALTYSAWKFSYTRLSRVMTVCQIAPRGPRSGGWLGTNWMGNAVDALTSQMQALTCEVTKAGRMLAGLILIALITSGLLRQSVTSSSQAMPATIILVVLAGICGFAGKISIDSLGGDGYLWLVCWEVLCFLHAFATTCTPWLHKYLYGPSSKFSRPRASSWMKLCSICARFSFHTFLVIALPIMAGLLPFASLQELNKAFWEFWESDAIIVTY